VGLETPEARATLNALKELAERSEAWAVAWSGVTQRAARLPAEEARQYLLAVESLRVGARPVAQAAVAELLRGSGLLRNPSPAQFLREAEWLVRREGLEEKVLNVLAHKASEGTVDLRWLGATGLTTEDLNYLGADKATAWKSFKAAADAPGNVKLLLQAFKFLRGIATEMVTVRSARSLFPQLTLVGRQVILEDKHIIDFELRADNGMVRRALEVKGWTADTWRRALQAWKATRGTSGIPTDPRRRQLLKQLDRLAAQLRDAAREPRGKPILVCSDKLSSTTIVDLEKFLLNNLLDVDVASVKELEIAATAKRLREAFRLPPLPATKRRRGTP
jgi:hypothetical protein